MPGFLPDDLVRKLAREAESLHQSGLLRSAATGQGQQREIRAGLRGDDIAWLDEQAASLAQGEFLTRMEALRLAANRELQLGLFDLEAHFARYPAGAGYRKHLDIFQQDSRRVLSVICYLNSAWREADSGQLRLYAGENDAGETKSVDIFPEGGTLVCFFSRRFPHEVLPAARTRLSLAGWFRQRA